MKREDWYHYLLETYPDDVTEDVGYRRGFATAWEIVFNELQLERERPAKMVEALKKIRDGQMCCVHPCGCSGSPEKIAQLALEGK